MLSSFRRRGLFPCDGLARSFPGARIRMGPLPPNRQTLTVAEPAVRAHINVTLNIRRYVTSKIALDFITLINDLTDPDHLVVREIVALGIELNPGRLKNFPRGISPDPVDISERNLHPLIFGQVHSSDARHILPLLSLNPYSIFDFRSWIQSKIGNPKLISLVSVCVGY